MESDTEAVTFEDAKPQLKMASEHSDVSKVFEWDAILTEFMKNRDDMKMGSSASSSTRSSLMTQSLNLDDDDDDESEEDDYEGYFEYNEKHDADLSSPVNRGSNTSTPSSKIPVLVSPRNMNSYINNGRRNSHNSLGIVKSHMSPMQNYRNDSTLTSSSRESNGSIQQTQRMNISSAPYHQNNHLLLASRSSSEDNIHAASKAWLAEKKALLKNRNLSSETVDVKETAVNSGKYKKLVPLQQQNKPDFNDVVPRKQKITTSKRKEHDPEHINQFLRIVKRYGDIVENGSKISFIIKNKNNIRKEKLETISYTLKHARKVLSKVRQITGKDYELILEKPNGIRPTYDLLTRSLEESNSEYSCNISVATSERSYKPHSIKDFKALPPSVVQLSQSVGPSISVEKQRNMVQKMLRLKEFDEKVRIRNQSFRTFPNEQQQQQPALNNEDVFLSKTELRKQYCLTIPKPEVKTSQANTPIKKALKGEKTIAEQSEAFLQIVERNKKRSHNRSNSLDSQAINPSVYAS